MFISVIGISLLIHYFCSNTILDVVYYAIQIVYTYQLPLAVDYDLTCFYKSEG